VRLDGKFTVIRLEITSVNYNYVTIIADRILKLEPNLYSNKSIIVYSDPKFTENADKVT
jgi:hypothetical protein